MKTAMILAAGRGARLRPLTDVLPKALCSVHGKPLIEHHVLHLAEAGFERLIINHAHLGGKIRQYLGDGRRWDLEIIYSAEPPGGLETAGGIVNARDLIGKEPFALVNADIYSDYAFKNLQLPSNSLAHLILVPKDPALRHFGDFGLSADAHVLNEPKDYTFAGISCYRPELFQNMGIGRYSMTPFLRDWAEQQLVSGEIYKGKWFDIGSTLRLEAARNAPLGK